MYEGTVVHQRPGPDGHGFEQQTRLAFVDLDAVDDLCARHPLWSAHRPAPVWFRRSDYLGDPTVPLAAAVRELVGERTGRRPSGPVCLLTHPRAWGWLFNPISCYFCFDQDGAAVESMVAEVTNTPWHERHRYVVGPPGVHHLSKGLHVSPFLGMGLDYRLAYTAPGPRLDISFSVSDPGGQQLFAGVRLRRRPADRRALAEMVWRPGEGTIGVSIGIYRQALALWRKGTPVHPHPRHSAPASSSERDGPGA